MAFSERQNFLLSIRDKPDEDTPRLVYADWLEEHGEPERAELVRLGVELRGLVNFGQDASVMVRHFPEPRKSELVHAVALQGRERKLAAASTADWLPAGFGYLISTGSATKQGAFIIINSGISVDVRCPWERWREHGDAIWERELPWRVRLTTAPGIQWGGSRSRPRGRFASLSGLDDFEFLEGAWDWKDGVDRLDPATMQLLSRRWPGIAFELPPARGERSLSDAAAGRDEFGPAEGWEQDVRDITDAAMQGMDLPRG